MIDSKKTKKQLIEELEQLRQQVTGSKNESTARPGTDRIEREQAEEALKKSERRLSFHLQNTPIVAIEWNLDFEVVDWNLAAEKVFGYTKGEALGRHAAGLLVPESARELVNGVWSDLLANKGGLHSTNENFTKDGRTIVCDWNNTPLIDDSGTVCGVASLVQDITESKAAEEALRESEEKYRNLVDRASDGVIIAQDGLAKFVNARMGDIFGFTVDEMIDTQFMNYVHPDERPRIIDIYQRRLQGEDVSGIYEMIGLNKNGEGVSIEINSGIILYDGKPAILSLVRDITERKQAEEALRESEERFKQLSEATWEGIALHHDGVILEANNQYFDMFGYDREELIGQEGISRTTTPESAELVREQIAQGNLGPYTAIGKKKDGTEFPIELRVRVMMYHGREVRVAAIRDMTARKRAEEALRESERRLLQSQYIAKIGDFIWEIASGKTTWSEGMYDLLKYDKDETIDFETVNTKIHHPDDLVRVSKWLADGIASGTEVLIPNEYRLVCKDGEVIWVQTNGRFEVRDGRAVKLFGTCQNITDRKQAEERLRISKEKFERYLDVSAEIVISLNAEGNIDLLNESGHIILGYANGELIGKNWFDNCLPEAQRNDVKGIFAKLMAGELESVKTYENPVITRAGDEKVILWHNSILHDSSGNICGLLSTGEDITERKQAEEAVHESEERFRDLAELLPEAVFETDANYKLTYANRRACKLFGYTPEDLARGMSSLDLLIPEDRALAQANIAKRLQGEDPGTIEYQALRKDGSTFPMLFHASSIVKDGVLRGLRGVIVDMTSRKQAEEALRESEERFRSIIENTEAGYFYIDREGIIRHVNEAWAKMYKYSSVDEILGKHFTTIQKADDVEKANEFVAGIMAGDVRYLGGEFSRKCKDDSIGYHTFSARPVSRSGEVVGIEGFIIDSTERKQAEEALRESKTQYEQLFNSMIDGFALHEIICDDSGKPVDYRFLAINPAFERLTGLKAADMIGQRAYEALPGLEPIWAERYGAVALTGEPIHFEQYSAVLDKHFEVTAYRPSPGQFACIFVDTTETKRLQALESRAARLEMAGTIAGQVAHDFNNLLSPIMAYPEFIHEELPHDHKAHAYLDAIETAAQKIADINQDLLTMGRRGHYNLSVVDLNRVALQVAHEAESRTKTVTCELDLCEDLMKIKGGDAQIHRMLTNLVVNAQDAMDDIGQITIRTENYYADDASVAFGRVPKGEYVKVTVTDEGCGISDDIMEKILDPFFSTKTTDKKRGSGLGLSVVDAVMKDHHGYLDLSSQVGQGTSFFLYFPVTREDFGEDEAERMAGGSETVLVVDDDDIQREVSSELLTKLGYRVTVVESGEQAVEFIRENPQDLVILDMVMPGGIDGTETYRQLLEFSPDQKAIILSGFSESDRVLEAQKLGCGGFVKKPVTRKTMAVAVRVELNREVVTKQP